MTENHHEVQIYGFPQGFTIQPQMSDIQRVAVLLRDLAKVPGVASVEALGDANGVRGWRVLLDALELNRADSVMTYIEMRLQDRLLVVYCLGAESVIGGELGTRVDIMSFLQTVRTPTISQ